MGEVGLPGLVEHRGLEAPSNASKAEQTQAPALSGRRQMSACILGRVRGLRLDAHAEADDGLGDGPDGSVAVAGMGADEDERLVHRGAVLVGQDALRLLDDGFRLEPLRRIGSSVGLLSPAACASDGVEVLLVGFGEGVQVLLGALLR